MADATEISLLDAAIARVWNEHDEATRLAAIREIYHPGAQIHEPERTISGDQAISDVVASVLADLPPDFRFEIIGSTLGHHGVAVTRWRGGPPGQTIVSGADAARIMDGQIHEHWFFFDPTV